MSGARALTGRWFFGDRDLGDGILAELGVHVERQVGVGGVAQLVAGWVEVAPLHRQPVELRQHDGRTHADHVLLTMWIVDRHPVRQLQPPRQQTRMSRSRQSLHAIARQSAMPACCRRHLKTVLFAQQRRHHSV